MIWEKVDTRYRIEGGDLGLCLFQLKFWKNISFLQTFFGTLFWKIALKTPFSGRFTRVIQNKILWIQNFAQIWLLLHFSAILFSKNCQNFLKRCLWYWKCVFFLFRSPPLGRSPPIQCLVDILSKSARLKVERKL